MRLTLSKRQKILKAIELGLLPKNVSCICYKAEMYLRGETVCYFTPFTKAEGRAWLGQALVDAGILKAPVVPEKEAEALDAYHDEPGQPRLYVPKEKYAAWYYPDDLLWWGVQEYLRRRK